MRPSILMVAVAMAAATASADHHEGEAKAVCPVMDRPIDKSISSDHMGGTVYFCCAKCKTKFDDDSSRYAAKANAQLVATGQAKQVKCPLTGRGLNPEKATAVGGVDVEFCCANCLAKVEKSGDEKAMQLVFAEKPFKTGFEVKK